MGEQNWDDKDNGSQTQQGWEYAVNVLGTQLPDLTNQLDALSRKTL